MYAANTVGTRDNVGTMGTREILRAWPVAENFAPHFRLPSAEMDPVQTSDYHKLRSLVIVFAGEYNPSTSPGLLSDLAGHYSEVTRKSAEVLVVVKGTPAE